MKLKKLTAMVLSASLVVSLAAASAFAAPPEGGAPGGPGGGPGGPAAEFKLEGQLSVWLKDGVVVAPGTEGATEKKVDRIVTSNEDNISSFGGGGTDASTVAGDDYAFVTALYVKDGQVVANQSVTEAISKGTYDGQSATGLVIKSEYEGFNPIIVVDSEYNITGANITIDSNGDGSKTCDFSGLGAAIAAYGDETVLVIDDSEVNVSGVANLGLFADDGADVIIKNSKMHSDGGTLYADYKNSPDQSTMVAPPWVLGIMGTSRGTNLMGNNSSTTVIDSEVSAAQWAVLSTDSGTNMKLNVVNTTMLLTGADYVMQNDDTFGDKAGKDSNPYTTRSGYGTYAIGNADEYFYGVDMTVGTYATIFTGGFGTYTAMKKGEEISLYDANGKVLETYTPTEDKVTTINSDTFGFMIHQGTNEITIEKGTVVNSGYTTFLLKTGASGSNVTADITSGSKLNPGNGILIQAMDNDDSTTGMISFSEGFNTTHTEEPGWHTAGNGAAADNTSTFNFDDVELVGDIFNGTGYQSAPGMMDPTPAPMAPTKLAINLSGDTSLTGMISATDIIHVTKEGSDAVKAAAAGEKASEDWLQYQLTSFPIGEYYNIGQVANRVFYNRHNDIDVTLTENATWKVTGDGIVHNLTAAADAITADKAVTITVKGVLTLDGEVVTGGTKVVGNVTYVVETNLMENYTDLAADAWYATGKDGETLKYVLAAGLMEGSSATTFSPDTALTREQLAVILYRAAGEPEVTDELTAPDAASVSSWAADAMKWAVAEGIITGDSAGNILPAGTVDRQTMAVMLFRWAEGTVAEDADLSAYTDAASVASWAVDGMTWAVAEGIVQGTNNELLPGNTVSRVQAAIMLGRYMQNQG